MKVEIYGTGCAKCTKLYELAVKAVDQTGTDAEVVKVSDLAEIMKAGIMITPALAIDGQVKISGRLPSCDEIKALLEK